LGSPKPLSALFIFPDSRGLFLVGLFFSSSSSFGYLIVVVVVVLEMAAFVDFSRWLEAVLYRQKGDN
jgi:hypothetical protein